MDVAEEASKTDGALVQVPRRLQRHGCGGHERDEDDNVPMERSEQVHESDGGSDEPQV